MKYDINFFKEEIPNFPKTRGRKRGQKLFHYITIKELYSLFGENMEIPVQAKFLKTSHLIPYKHFLKENKILSLKVEKSKIKAEKF